MGSCKSVKVEKEAGNVISLFSNSQILLLRCPMFDLLHELRAFRVNESLEDREKQGEPRAGWFQELEIIA